MSTYKLGSIERKRSLSELAPYQDPTEVIYDCMCELHHVVMCPNWERYNSFYRLSPSSPKAKKAKKSKSESAPEVQVVVTLDSDDA